MQGWHMPGCLPSQAPAAKRQRLQDFGGSWPGSFSEGNSCGSGCGACCGSGGCGCSGADPSMGMGSSGGHGMSWSGCGGCNMNGAMNPMQFAQVQMAQMQAMAAFNSEESNMAAPPDTEERYYGLIRDYNEGFGFIECDDAKMRYGMDVFIHRRQMFGLAKGDEVSFVIVRNSQGQPQARHVIKKEETARILEKRKDRERREAAKLAAKKQASEKVFTPSTMEGKVMSEEEARKFQASLKRGR
eukprot:Skav215757  [mRNA]  locus=scaffold106:273626:285650:+ [translate_table: standard]